MLGDDFVGIDQVVDFLAAGFVICRPGCCAPCRAAAVQLGDLPILLRDDGVGHFDRAFDRGPLLLSGGIVVGRRRRRQGGQQSPLLRFPVHAACSGVAGRSRAGRGQLRFELGVLRLQLADVLDRQLESPLQIGHLLLDVGIDLRGRPLFELSRPAPRARRARRGAQPARPNRPGSPRGGGPGRAPARPLARGDAARPAARARTSAAARRARAPSRCGPLSTPSRCSFHEVAAVRGAGFEIEQLTSATLPATSRFSSFELLDLLP